MKHSKLAVGHAERLSGNPKVALNFPLFDALRGHWGLGRVRIFH